MADRIRLYHCEHCSELIRGDAELVTDEEGFNYHDYCEEPANEDVHVASAAEIYGVSPEEVTEEQRDKAKKINFGLLYGANIQFADPGGESALRAGVRTEPCPTCGHPGRLTKEDVRLGYQCDQCAEALERGC